MFALGAAGILALGASARRGIEIRLGTRSPR